MMQVLPVDSDAIQSILGWRSERGLPPWPERWLSQTGFWVPDIAAAWLVMTNAGRCFLEDAITHISELATELGYSYILGTTMLPGVREEVARAGYTNTTEAER